MATRTEAQLIPHRKVARRFGITTETLRDWAAVARIVGRMRGEIRRRYQIGGQP